jgi:hypothetical protein
MVINGTAAILISIQPTPLTMTMMTVGMTIALRGLWTRKPFSSPNLT